MNEVPVVRLAQTDDDLHGILALQAQNHEAQLTPEEVEREGFVTARHDLSLLRRMHAEHPSIIATADEKVVAYVLMMPKSFRDALPVLRPMFEVFDGVPYLGRPLSEHRYFVNGQACVSKPFRGQGLLDRIFDLYRKTYGDRFDLMLTEIARRNTRSLRAHQRVGFRVVHSYRDSSTNELWDIVAWDWSR